MNEQLSGLEMDDAYLASSEINFFLRHLFAQVVALKPDDAIDYAGMYVSMDNDFTSLVLDNPVCYDCTVLISN